jgi:lysophospholipase L1-like esterase
VLSLAGALVITAIRGETRPVIVVSSVALFIFGMGLSSLVLVFSGRPVRAPKGLLRFKLVQTALAFITDADPQLTRDPWLLAKTGAFQLAIIACDAATLWILLRSLGVTGSPSGVFASFMVSSLLRSIGFMPGGLGIFEAASVATLKMVGVPIGAGLAATLLFRGLSFWFPMLPGLWFTHHALAHEMRPGVLPMVVACLGSSSTQGKGQAFDWVGELRVRPENRGVRFLNFGKGGDVAYDTLQRLPRAIRECPTKVIVQVGGNDVLASVFQNMRRFVAFSKRLPRDLSPSWYEENLRLIARKLTSETAARVALCSLAPIGEEPKPESLVQQQLNQLVEDYSGIVQRVAEQEGAVYLPFYERMREQIVASPGRSFTSFRFLPFYRDAFLTLMLRRSVDEIAERNHWRFHSDGIHLNSRGGRILAELVQGFVRA